jgi:NADH dehydrogenase FAD-containing subunit
LLDVKGKRQGLETANLLNRQESNGNSSNWIHRMVHDIAVIGAGATAVSLLLSLRDEARAAFLSYL